MAFSSFYNLILAQPAGIILALVTAFVGVVALYIYFRQHQDEKVLAAQTIFSEISTAENTLQGIRTRFFAVEYPVLEQNVIMRYESWSKYKHLFLKELTNEEWNLIDQFYNNCLAYDSAVLTNKANIRLLIEANYKHQYDQYAETVAAFHASNPKAVELPEEQLEELLAYQQLFLSDKTKSRFDYIPRQGVSEARTALVALDTAVSVSTAGQKLKQIAKL